MRHASHRSAPRRGGRAPTPSASRMGRKVCNEPEQIERAQRGPPDGQRLISDRQPTANPATSARSAPAPAQRYPTMATTRAQRGCQARSAPSPPTAACDRSNPVLSCTATQHVAGSRVNVDQQEPPLPKDPRQVARGLVSRSLRDQGRCRVGRPSGASSPLARCASATCTGVAALRGTRHHNPSYPASRSRYGLVGR
jgi:hypothetical protein